MGAAAREPWLAEAVGAGAVVLPGRAFAVVEAVVVEVVVAAAVEVVAGTDIVVTVAVDAV